MSGKLLRLVLVVSLLAGFLAAGSAQDRASRINKALADLESTTQWTRETAALDLSRLAPDIREAIPALTKALDDPSTGVRWNAAKALGIVGPPAREAVPALARTLKTNDWSGCVQAMSAWALYRIGPAAGAATPALIANLRDSHPLARREAARALGAIGPEAREAATALQTALTDDCGYVRVAAAVSLIQVAGDDRGFPLLLEALSDQTIVGARVAADALAEVGPSASGAVPALTTVLSDPASCARVAAARALWLIARDARGVPQLIKALQDEAPEVRHTAAEALRVIQSQSASPPPQVAEALKAYEIREADPPPKSGEPQPLVFKALDWTGPADAIVSDQDLPNKWKLSTNDPRWSRHMILVSPIVRQDRATPEEGAPVLHTHITGIPRGRYSVTVGYTRPLALSLDEGKTWQKFAGENRLGESAVEDGIFDLWVDDRYADANSIGGSYYDTLTFTPLAAKRIYPPVVGWAKTRVHEKLGRGLHAVVLPQGGVYLSWRLLADDPKNAAFDVFRREGAGPKRRLNKEPIGRTTDFIDAAAQLDKSYEYTVLPAGRTEDRVPSPSVRAQPTATPLPYTSLKLAGKYAAQGVGIGDLDGDGQMDFVVKQPDYSIDPWYSIWHRSPTTHKLEAYNQEGELLWRYDMGWGIELGVWFSPFVVYDLDGDGRAEVACKAAEGDPRDADGKVFSGPEHVIILDGRTGQVRARAPWPSRDGFTGEAAHNYAGRNQLGVAFLDGKTPCLVLERGTYGLQKLATYQLRGNSLVKLWDWDNRDLGARWWAQGAHTLHAADVDEDGCDELIVGSSVLDHNGAPLWTTGMGHCDNCYVGKFDPALPGLQIFYNYEVAQSKNGYCLVDAKTGKILWGLKEQSYHMGFGAVSDIDATHPGCEVWVSEDPKGDPQGQGYKGDPPRWLLSAQGEVLGRQKQVPGMGLSAAHWDEDMQRELIQGGQIRDYEGGVQLNGLSGGVSMVADIWGDWREEIVTSLPGELRIYSTAIPAADRRATLLQDPIYRLDVAMVTTGYAALPQTATDLGAGVASLRLIGPEAGLFPKVAGACTALVVAPTTQALQGTLRLSAGPGAVVEPTTIAVQVAAGHAVRLPFTLRVTQRPPPLTAKVLVPLSAVLEQGGVNSLPTKSLLPLADQPLTNALLIEAEDFCEQSGGEVHLRTDKPGSSGQAFSHWDNRGHRLQWQVTVAQAGRYYLVLRYATGNDAERSLLVDGKPLPGAERLRFMPSGESAPGNFWAHQPVCQGDGQPVPLDLTVGAHRIVMENVDGHPLNLDYLALVRD